MKIITLISRLACLCILLSAKQAYALTCHPINATQSYNQATLVFVGELIDVNRSRLKNLKHPEGRFHNIELFFEVIKVWKGSADNYTNVLYSVYNDGRYDDELDRIIAKFQRGGTYLFFLNKEDLQESIYVVNECSRFEQIHTGRSLRHLLEIEQMDSGEKSLMYNYDSEARERALKDKRHRKLNEIFNRTN